MHFFFFFFFFCGKIFNIFEYAYFHNVYQVYPYTVRVMDTTEDMADIFNA